MDPISYMGLAVLAWCFWSTWNYKKVFRFYGSVAKKGGPTILKWLLKR